MPLICGSALGEAWGPVAGSAGTGVDAVDFSVESAATGVAAFTGQSVGGDDITTCGPLVRMVRSRLLRQLATISSPKKEPKVSTFCKGGWKSMFELAWLSMEDGGSDDVVGGCGGGI